MVNSNAATAAVNIWDADIAIDADLATRLIIRQFPHLAPLSLTLLGSGWDNVAYLADERYVFRFPHRRIAVDLLETEARCLPLFAPRLPLPVPMPTFAGVAEADYPFPFVGYELLAGTTACRTRLTDAERAACAASLADFLRTLHAFPVDEATRSLVPGDELDRANISKRSFSLKQRLERLTPFVPEGELADLCQAADDLSWTLPYAGKPRLLHGDLYARHLLVDDAHALCGVIDWGDVHRGDPALDLSIAFSFLPPDARPAFRNAYGPIDSAMWDRARFRALHYGAILTLYGADIGDDPLRDAGLYALRVSVAE